MRGAGAAAHLAHGAVGIIPARAGSRKLASCSLRGSRDHPRACGEQSDWRSTLRPEMGSSPRVRGAVIRLVAPALNVGIIPARAGSSRMTSIRPTASWDHPRACGEQHLDRGLSRVRSGSSPRVRGAVIHFIITKLLNGIIPARAGSRSDVGLPSALGRDHPRACGEQSKLLTTHAA